MSSGSDLVKLTPTAGFVVKSTTTSAAVYALSSPSPQTQRVNPNLLEPAPKALIIPEGLKAFINIAWDPKVPPPPPAGEATIRRAMLGEDSEALMVAAEGSTSDVYVVPVVVSEPREDFDKAGKRAIVFDCVFSSTLKSRSLKDAEYRTYLIELALEHVEDKAKLTLSRQVATPNILSKGKLEPRTVRIPSSLHPSTASKSATSESGRKLIEEITPRSTSNGSPLMSQVSKPVDKGKGKAKEEMKPKSILKNSVSPITATENYTASPLIQEISSTTNLRSNPQPEKDPNGSPSKITGQISSTSTVSHSGSVKNGGIAKTPKWSWSLEPRRLRGESTSGSGSSASNDIRVVVEVPELTRSLYSDSTLDLEPRRIILSVPGAYHLDINLNLSDAQLGKIDFDINSISSASGQTMIANVMNESGVGSGEDRSEAETEVRIRGKNAGEAMKLKRVPRDLDMNSSRAEWRVGEGKLIIWA